MCLNIGTFSQRGKKIRIIYTEASGCLHSTNWRIQNEWETFGVSGCAERSWLGHPRSPICIQAELGINERHIWRPRTFEPHRWLLHWAMHVPQHTMWDWPPLFPCVTRLGDNTDIIHQPRSLSPVVTSLGPITASFSFSLEVLALLRRIIYNI